MGNSLSLAPQAVFQDRLLVNIQWLKLLSIHQVLWTILEKFVSLNARLQGYDLGVGQVLINIIDAALNSKQLPVKICEVVLFV